MRQIHSYVTDPTCKRLGHQTWVALSILLTEVLIIVKFGRGEFPDPIPKNVQIGK